MPNNVTNAIRGRRRKPKEHLASSVWAYLTPEERELINRVAQIKRLSNSSFVAQAALKEAHLVLRENRKNPED